VDTLEQNFLFRPALHKETYLVYLLTQMQGKKTIIFTSTCNASLKLVLMLKFLNFKATNIHGKMSQQMRLASLNKFKTGEKTILIATDVASRGLDIPSVDLVINFDIPGNSKDYVHRVGRTARAGRSGRAITMVTQYDVEIYKKIEELIGKTLEEYPVENKHALVLSDSVIEAMRQATIEMRDSKYLKEDEGDGEKDDAEADLDKDMFKKRTYKNSGKLSHSKGFSGSFARKRQRTH
jgi:ATP-dependent RNA helicase DDX47/RRP3